MRAGLLLLFLTAHWAIFFDVWSDRAMAQDSHLQQLRDILAGAGLPSEKEVISNVQRQQTKFEKPTRQFKKPTGQT